MKFLKNKLFLDWKTALFPVLTSEKFLRLFQSFLEREIIQKGKQIFFTGLQAFFMKK